MEPQKPPMKVENGISKGIQWKIQYGYPIGIIDIFGWKEMVGLKNKKIDFEIRYVTNFPLTVPCYVFPVLSDKIY